MIVRLLLTVLMADLSSAVALKSLQMADLLPRGPIPKTLPVTIIPLDTEITVNVTKSRTEFPVLVHQDTDRLMSVTVTPCNTRLNWDFKFIPLTNNIPIILVNNTLSGLGTTLVEYTGVFTSATYEHGKAYKGLYVITAQAVDDISQVTFYVSLKQKAPKNFPFRPNIIKIKTNGQKVNLRWNLSHEDHHLMKYALVVSTSKIYSILCEAESRIKEMQKWDSMSNDSEDDILPFDNQLQVYHLGSSRSYTLTNLVYDTTYYFTVFALNGNRTAVLHANATFTFQRPKPIGLKDAIPERVNLRALNGKVSFRYKVGNRFLEADGDLNTLYWYVMPCGGVVNVEIRCKKTLLIEKRVFGYEKLILNNIKYGERYVLKVETVSIDEIQQVGLIEVMATMRPVMFPMPDMPTDLSIRQYQKPNDCKSVTIGWLPAKSHTDLKYCVYLTKDNPYKNVDFSAKPNQCVWLYGNSGKRNNVGNEYRRKIRCYNSGETEGVSIEKILKLKALTSYVVQVTVSKPRGRTLSYDLLKLDTNSCGIN